MTYLTIAISIILAEIILFVVLLGIIVFKKINIESNFFAIFAFIGFVFLLSFPVLLLLVPLMLGTM